MLNKVCYNCKHIYVSAPVPDWSDVTPGSPFRMGCDKGHWYFDPDEDTNIQSIRECLETATNCADFTETNHV